MTLTPGLYREPTLPVRGTGPMARGDVALFLGYAQRGPVGVPVRIESLALYETLFGPRPLQGFLWPAVKGFFENGGAACYAMRLTDQTAAASRTVLGSWRAIASFPWLMIDPRRLGSIPQTAAASWVQVIEAQLREGGPRGEDPGTWGNGLTLEVKRTSRGRTETIPDSARGPTALALASFSGIEIASVLGLSQSSGGGAVVTAEVQPLEVDPPRRTIVLAERPAQLGFDAARPIRIETVEFGLEIRLNGVLEQSFTGLAPDPRHSRALSGVIERECRSLHLLAPPAADWTGRGNWPAEGVHALGGGSDGLSAVNASTWLAALPAIERLSEPAMIAAPDLVLPGPRLPPRAVSIPARHDCADLAVPAEGRLAGRVTTGDKPDAPDSGEPVAGALVDVSGVARRATTDADGNFTVGEVPLGLLTVQISKPGFVPLEVVVQSGPFELPAAAFELEPRTEPRVLSSTEVLQVAQALGNPALVGPYKIAFIDPPGETARIDDLRSWGSQLGDHARLGLFAPWLRVTSADGGDEGMVSVPPSGHVCGAFAAAEREIGLQQTGANRQLRFVDALTLAIDDGEQGVLNPSGINAIRAFPGRGIRINGARTLSSEPAFRYLSTRRIVDAIEKTLESSLAWAVFEPNNLFTRHTITVAIDAFLNRLWRNGALAGGAPEAAYRITCDTSNNTNADRSQGRLNIDIGVAPAAPYEFVLFRLGHAQDALHVTE